MSDKKKKAIRLKAGDPQPFPCKKCWEFCGYQISDTIQVQYIDTFNEDGTRTGGFYGDSIKYIHTGRRATCLNCDSFLFSLEKE